MVDEWLDAGEVATVVSNQRGHSPEELDTFRVMGAALPLEHWEFSSSWLLSETPASARRRRDCRKKVAECVHGFIHGLLRPANHDGMKKCAGE